MALDFCDGSLLEHYMLVWPHQIHLGVSFSRYEVVKKRPRIACSNLT